MITCTNCKTEIHPLAVFPGDICLDCHAKAFDNAPQPTAEEIAAMWRNPKLYN